MSLCLPRSISQSSQYKGKSCQTEYVSVELEHSHASAGVCRVLVLGGLGDVAVAPKDLARRVFFTADTGDANTPSVVAITFFIEGESFALVGVPVFTGLHRATSLRSLVDLRGSRPFCFLAFGSLAPDVPLLYRQMARTVKKARKTVKITDAGSKTLLPFLA